ncbi:zinc finger protein [Elysia marginata]|uniref:Zinc finger protein n=1 Tax=Elysia marginata TaxID=1093978 RepID=A0AAV4IKP9_9GAST|nr:zinc finger protein [Elysia marginata]
MEDLEIIRKRSSPYSSPVVVVKKKDSSNRVCIDYRRLSKPTIFYPQPMIPPADIFQGMEKDQYFSKLDLSKGYWQIPVCKEDILKTAFVTMDCH